MAEILPRNVVISLIMVVFAFTAGIFLFTGFYSAQSVTLPTEIALLQENTTSIGSSLNSTSGNLSNTFEDDTDKGTVSSACTALLGDDNFFCSGLATLGVITDTPSQATTTMHVFQQRLPVDVPVWIFATLISIITITIIFVLLSAYRRYRS